MQLEVEFFGDGTTYVPFRLSNFAFFLLSPFVRNSGFAVACLGLPKFLLESNNQFSSVLMEFAICRSCSEPVRALNSRVLPFRGSYYDRCVAEGKLHQKGGPEFEAALAQVITRAIGSTTYIHASGFEKRQRKQNTTELTFQFPVVESVFLILVGMAVIGHIIRLAITS